MQTSRNVVVTKVYSLRGLSCHFSNLSKIARSTVHHLPGWCPLLTTRQDIIPLSSHHCPPTPGPPYTAGIHLGNPLHSNSSMKEDKYSRAMIIELGDYSKWRAKNDLRLTSHKKHSYEPS
ncbi:hypothetical protein Tco_0529752 [Tanacetum coccineum]